ncbi:uncharacterized protein [Asterias amurensis]|uniref:uncharacterized protein n=1 Tax=Asterias amurensis TaxID=7602 RepID=UPI003AB1988C
MLGIRAVFVLSLMVNVLVNGYQEERNVDGELEVLLKRLQELLEDEERVYKDLSGVEVNPEVGVVFNDMKHWKTIKWVTFKLENNEEIVVDIRSGRPRGLGADQDQFNEIKDSLPSEPRYVLFNFHFMDRIGREIQKVAFIFWSNDDDYAGSRNKMIYSSAKETIKKEFAGIGLEFVADEKHELDYDTFQAKLEYMA